MPAPSGGCPKNMVMGPCGRVARRGCGPRHGGARESGPEAIDPTRSSRSAALSAADLERLTSEPYSATSHR